MDIKLGTVDDEKTFTNTVVGISRQKTTSTYKMIDGSVKIQEAPLVKKVFDITLVRPTSTEVGWIETEYDKGTTLKLIHNSVDYTVKFVFTLDKSTDAYEISFTLQEV